MSAVTALLLALTLGPAMIRWLRAAQVRQSIRQEAQSHLAKAGTPTMGGLLIILAVATATLLWMDLSNRFSGSHSARSSRSEPWASPTTSSR